MLVRRDFPQEVLMKLLVLATLLAVAACTEPMLSTGVVFTPEGVAVNPTLSARVGGGTVYIQP